MAQLLALSRASPCPEMRLRSVAVLAYFCVVGLRETTFLSGKALQSRDKGVCSAKICSFSAQIKLAHVPLRPHD